MLKYHLDCASVTWWVAYQNSILTIWDLFTRGQWQKTYFFSILGRFKCCRVVVVCSRKSCFRPPEVLHLGVSQYNDSPYDHSITCSEDHLRRVNSNSLEYLHILNPCKSHSSHHKYVSFSAPPLFPNPSNDFKIPLQLRVPLTQSYHAPTFKTPLYSLLPHLLPLYLENLPTPGIRHVNHPISSFLW